MNRFGSADGEDPTTTTSSSPWKTTSLSFIDCSESPQNSNNAQTFLENQIRLKFALLPLALAVGVLFDKITHISRK